MKKTNQCYCACKYCAYNKEDEVRKGDMCKEGGCRCKEEECDCSCCE